MRVAYAVPRLKRGLEAADALAEGRCGMNPLGRPAWAELADQLVDMVVSGQLQPGQRLVESDIAERFGISRGPVRTALSWLERGGLVEVLPTRGMIVVKMTAADVVELYEVRIALEAAATELVCERGPTPDFSRLEAHLAQLVTANDRGDTAEATRADLAFHLELCQLSGNKRLVRAWESLSNQIRLVIGTLQGEDAEVIMPLLLDHRNIYQALVSDDSAAATDLLRRHLLGTRDAMVSAINQAASQLDRVS